MHNNFVEKNLSSRRNNRIKWLRLPLFTFSFRSLPLCNDLGLCLFKTSVMVVRTYDRLGSEWNKKILSQASGASHAAPRCWYTNCIVRVECAQEDLSVPWNILILGLLIRPRCCYYFANDSEMDRAHLCNTYSLHPTTWILLNAPERNQRHTGKLHK